MREISFKVWHRKEKKMYFRGYQKFLHVLLCEDDLGKNEGKGRPVKRAGYGDCIFLEGTGIFDKKGAEIFEGDKLLIRTKNSVVQGVVEGVPDMFRSRRLHPLHELLVKNGIREDDILEMEILGNEYESEL